MTPTGKAKRRADGSRRITGPEVSRREFLRTSALAALASGVIGFPHLAKAASRTRRTIVLGVDGMDPKLLTAYIRQGLTPNCKKLAARGVFTTLGTSDPPQSPVAWSNFISGGDPGLHGIFDFIARDSATLTPYLSTARTTPARLTLPLGKYALPVAGANAELLRQGPTLWKNLDDAGVPATVFRAPVNFPPTPSGARTLSGLTTPDIHGSYGIFSLYSEDPARAPQDVPGGHIERIAVIDGRAKAKLRGPANSLTARQENVDIPFTVELNPERTMARIRIQNNEFLLREKEWSPWAEVSFPLMPPVAHVSAICRFYLKQTRPNLELYVTPVNIHPEEPAMPIATPPGYARELVSRQGLFYTQGLPEDTSALTSGVFDDDEFRKQSTDVFDEQMRFARLELDRFTDGFLFIYFSTLDLNSHAFWRCIDRKHPLYTPELARRHGDYLPSLYARIDEAVGLALQHIDEDSLLLVVSDHGFGSFRRQFNLNSWLMNEGYAKPKNRLDRGQASYFADTDWTQTKAYGLGINSLYLNLKGREPDGIVAPGEEAERVKAELIARLEGLRDPATGEPVIAKVHRPEDIYTGPCVALAPDLIVGYAENHRASWDTILGKYPQEVLLDNMSPWSGDHCMDASFLPGVLLCNRPLTGASPALQDMAPTILSAFGVPVPREMKGRRLFG